MKVLEKHLMKTIARLMVFAFIVAGINIACTYTTLAQIKNGAVKNVILMVSDGCGFNHIDAASYYQYGKAGVQVYEHFPTACAMSTYSKNGEYDPIQAWKDFNYVKDGATDSAAAATAISTGYKTYDMAIGGVGDGTELGFKPKKHILEHAEELGKSTGVVTSVQISHATPAGFVAHNWKRDNYTEIANEMINESAIDVIMGCGNPDFYVAPPTPPPGSLPPRVPSPPGPFPPPLPKDPNKYVGGIDTWNALKAGTAGGDADGDNVPDHWTLIQTRHDFRRLANGPTPKRVIGVVANVYTTLQQERGGDSTADPYKVPLTDDVPTLEEMTKAALNVLDNNAKGFFLMIEGGAVDGASHAGQSGRVIEEQIDFNHSVEAVIDWVDKNSTWRETLLIVTADHETGYLLGPYSGPDFDPMWQPIVNNGEDKLPGMLWYNWLDFPIPSLGPPMPLMTGHTNSLVPFFAKGDAAMLFQESADQDDPERGQYLDNTEIADVITANMN